MSPTIRVDGLRPADRERIAHILRATGVFRPDEIDVALELFDAGCGMRDAGGDEQPLEESSLPRGSSASRIPHPASRTPPSTDSDYLFLGAFTPEDELVGYACYGPTPGTDRTYDLYWIAVDPAMHGTGIGTTLLTEVERRLTGQHARLLVVETSSRSDYAATRAFYRRCGYTESARVREFYAPGDDRIIFTKRFHHSPAQAGSIDRHE
ncbi:MAG TPA: GNAT family N-acetyltransferase [Gemmatimonadaceae bacterium]